MITLNDKQKIILPYIREIHRLTGISRTTINIEDYKSKLQKLSYETSDIEKINLIEEITNIK